MINISNIQHFSVGDGPGIRTTVFLKGCNLRCPWCHNPENLSAAPVTLRYETKKCETLGRLVDAEDILPELLEDADFFGTEGGITLSGGEAMLQASDLLPLLRLLKEREISVMIDTAGCVPYEDFQKTNPFVFGYLFDYKTADKEKYRAIGASLATVEENILRLLSDGIAVFIRIPLIPGFNTDEGSVSAICERLLSLGIKQVELLPFHRLGSGKYEAMGLDYKYKSIKPLEKSEVRFIQSIYEKYFTVKVEE